MALPTDWQNRIQKEAGIRTLALGPEAHVQVNDPRYVSDAYQYFLNQGGGQDAATMPATTVAQDPTTMIPQTGGQGITSASAAQNMGGACGAQNPLTQIPVGQTQTVKQLMTSPEAYSLPGESDPFLASGAAGGARLPATQATTTLPSGDVFASDDPMLAEKMDYTQQDPTFWENAKNKFLSTGEDVGNFFTNLKNKGEDIARLTGGAIMNMVVPGAGLLMNFLPKSASGAQQKLVADQLVDSGVVLDNVGRIVQQPGLAYDTPENIMAGYNPGETGMQIGDLKIGGGTVQHSAADRIATLEKTKQEKYGGSFFNEDGSPKINPVTGQPTTLGSREAALREFINMGAAEAAGGVRLEDYDPGGDIVMAAPGAPTTYTKPQAGEVIYGTEYFPELGQEATAPTTIDELAGVDEGLKSRLLRGGKGPGEISKVAGTTIVDPDTYLGSKVDVGRSAMGTIDRTQPTEPVTGVEGPPSILSPEISRDPIMDMAAEQEAAAAIETARQEQASKDLGQSLHGGTGDKAGMDQGGFDPGGGFVDQGGAGEFGATTGTGTELRSDPDYGQFARRQQATSSGGGGGNSSNGGGKIVCTMMNESYGFGSFRNKIWLKHSKDLAPEYQIGYHKIFLPLVKLSKKNIVLKKVLEHIAIHRTIDIRQEARGKVHLLGRIYRKILEPICYWVGKYAKR